jgi:hypothetical protein
MKKTILLIMSIALCFALLTSCKTNDTSSTPESTTPVSTVAEYDVNEILTAIDTAVPVSEPTDINEQTLSLLINVNMDNVVAFAGKITQLNQNTDQIIVIQAQPGMANAVAEDLAAWRQANVDLSANYEEFAGEGIKAENGRIVINGDFVVLVILGDGEDMLANGPDAFYAEVDAAITAAFA